MTTSVIPRTRLLPLLGAIAIFCVIAQLFAEDLHRYNLDLKWGTEVDPLFCHPNDVKVDSLSALSNALETIKRLRTQRLYKGLEEQFSDYYRVSDSENASSSLHKMICLLESNNLDRGEPMKQALRLLQDVNEDQATAACERWYKRCQARFGANSPEILDSLVFLSSNYHRRSRYEEQLQLYRKWVDITEKHYGLVSYPTEISLINLASFYHRLHRHDEAIPTLRRALFVVEKVGGRASLSYACSMRELALEYLAVGRIEDAERCLQESLSSRILIDGEKVRSTPYMMIDFGFLLLEQGYIESAEVLFSKALNKSKMESHSVDCISDSQRSYAGLAYCNERRGRAKEALEFIEKAIELSDVVWDPENLSRERLKRDRTRIVNHDQLLKR